MTEAEHRELDAEVAEKVMGYERWTCSDYNYKEAILYDPIRFDGLLGSNSTWRKCPSDTPLAEGYELLCKPYSTDIAAAFTVVIALLNHGYQFTFNSAAGGWVVYVKRERKTIAVSSKKKLPEAICRAALKASPNHK